MGKAIGGRYQEPSTLEADPDLLDPQIRPLVLALNQTGWARTIFSCAGHPEEPDSITKGRRQAHIDLLVNDLPRWRTLVQTLKRATKGIRVTEGPLGPVPGWLAAERGFGGSPPLGPRSGQDSLGVQGNNEHSRSESTGVRGRLGQGAASLGRRSLIWHYRRLVIEPKPYAMPSDQCRATLDAALDAAMKAL